MRMGISRAARRRISLKRWIIAGSASTMVLSPIVCLTAVSVAVAIIPGLLISMAVRAAEMRVFASQPSPG
jgi:hypothetical protein